MGRRTSRSSRLLSLALVVGLAVGLGWGIAHAAIGDLDPTFDGDGLVTTNFHNTADEVHAVAIQPDGKLVVVGTTLISGNDTNFSVARYNADGSPDTSFSSDGRLTTGFFATPYDADVASGVAIQPDGKIVVVGSAYAYMAVARYNPDGTLDTTFEDDGKVVTDFDGHARGYAVAIQNDGKIVVAGEKLAGDLSDLDFAVARLNTDGSFDTTFDGDGKVSTDFFGGDDEARAVAIQPDGKIVEAGYTHVSGLNYDFALARYNADGSRDNTFGGDGKVTIDFFGGDDGAYALALQPDGNIVAAGGAFYEPSSYNFAVARLLANGDLDTGFGVGGIKVEDLGGGGIDDARGVAIQSDGKIVAAGYAPVDGVNRFALARFNPDGFLDSSFGGGDGWLTTDFGGGVAIAYGVAVQLDGRIVTAGTAYMGDTNNYDFALARYLVSDLPTPTPTSTATPPSRYGYLPLVLK